jgi:hypothetical protein
MFKTSAAKSEFVTRKELIGAGASGDTLTFARSLSHNINYGKLGTLSFVWTTHFSNGKLYDRGYDPEKSATFFATY